MTEKSNVKGLAMLNYQMEKGSALRIAWSIPFLLFGCHGCVGLVESDIHAFEQASQHLSVDLDNWASMSAGATASCSAQQVGNGSPTETIDGYLYGGVGSRRYWYPGATQQAWVAIDFNNVREISNILILTWIPGGGWGVRKYSVDAWDNNAAKWRSPPIIGTNTLTTSGFSRHSFDPIETSRIRLNVQDADGSGPVIVEIAAFGPSESKSSYLVSPEPSPGKQKPGEGIERTASWRAASKARFVCVGIGE